MVGSRSARRDFTEMLALQRKRGRTRTEACVWHVQKKSRTASLLGSLLWGLRDQFTLL